MNEDHFPPPPGRTTRHSWVGIASFVAGGLAFVAVVVTLIAFFSPSYWASEGNTPVDGLPLAALVLVLLGSGLGIGSLFHAGTKKIFGILGLVMGALTITICCCLFALIFVSSGGFGG